MENYVVTQIFRKFHRSDDSWRALKERAEVAGGCPLKKNDVIRRWIFSFSERETADRIFLCKTETLSTGLFTESYFLRNFRQGDRTGFCKQETGPVTGF